MFSIPLTLQSIAISGLLGLLIGLGGGGVAVWSFYSPRLALCKEEKKSLGDTISAQNAGVKKLETDAKTRAANAAKAVADAKKGAATAQSEVLALMNKAPPTGVDLCTAASALIWDELKKGSK